MITLELLAYVVLANATWYAIKLLVQASNDLCRGIPDEFDKRDEEDRPHGPQ